MLTQCIGGHEQRPRALPLQLYGEIAERDKRLLNPGMSHGRDVGVQRELLLPGLAGPELDKLPAEAVLEDPPDRLVDRTAERRAGEERVGPVKSGGAGLN